MKLYRYMSWREFSNLSSGVILKNNKSHKAKTASVGFCFLGENTEFHSRISTERGEEYVDCIYSPLNCYNFLSGIVSRDVLVEFEADENSVTESFGVYADPIGAWDSCIVIKEYCCNAYSRDTLRPLRYTPDFGAWNVKTPVWYDFN